jgi:hypothetical protein
MPAKPKQMEIGIPMNKNTKRDENKNQDVIYFLLGILKVSMASLASLAKPKLTF